MKKILLGLVLWADLAAAQVVIKERVVPVAVTPTVDTSAYASGDDIGGKLTFTNAVCSTASSFKVQGVVVSDKSSNAVAYDLVLFSANPASTTFTDQAALDIADGDLAKVLPIVNIASTDQFTFADNSVSSLSSLASGGFVTATGGTLYGALVSRGTPTYASSSDVTVTLITVCN